MEVGLVRQIDIDSEMQQAYLDYAMSVIVSRALPDARDGLKPVHRRILHAMHAMGIRPETPFRKSARIVGEVLGKYHPHGDMAVYDAMARMAQDFSMRYMLVEGQGNFGSIDGDPPAAMRYTEARLAPMALDLLADIDKDTVAFDENFDGSLEEPRVLPAAVPNMLVNGATGIAVGMSTSIPPHNLSEVIDASIVMLELWTKMDEISLDDLMQHVRGPDFPTGGIILQSHKEGEGLMAAYATGRGKITLQARAHFEGMGRGRSRIIVTELPYQTNKANLIERIADLARDGKLEGITDLRDESDRQGMRIVIELSKTAEPENVLRTLYKRTPMQGTFSMIMLALVDGQPRLLSLKQALRVYLEHRLEVIRRRSEFDLARNQARAHILEGLRTAIKNLDEVIQTIRDSRDAEQAGTRLEKRFKLSSEQARAILDMPLRRLASLERKKIDQEYKDVTKRIQELEALLGSKKRMRTTIADELRAIKDKYGDRRRTLIAEPGQAGKMDAPLTASDLAPAKDTWIQITREGKISRTTTARLPRISGRSAPRLVMGANARDILYLFTDVGLGAALAVHTIPETDDPERGVPAGGLTAIPEDEDIVTGLAVPTELQAGGEQEAFIVFGTASGMVKKTELSNLPGPSARTFQAINVSQGDSLLRAALTSGSDEIMLVSSGGLAIRFSETDIRPMGLSAAGVMGMRMEEGDQRLVGMDVIRPGQQLLVVSEDGRGKRSKLADFPTQGRYGKGVLAWKSNDPSAIAGAMLGEATDRATAVMERRADRSIRLGDAKSLSRPAAGQPLFEVEEDDRVVRLIPVLGRGELPQGNEPKPAPKSKPSPRKGTGRKSKAASKGRSSRKTKKDSGAKKKSPAKSKGKSSGKKSSKGSARRKKGS
jgi:DNA gyrase subunit A